MPLLKLLFIFTFFLPVIGSCQGPIKSFFFNNSTFKLQAEIQYNPFGLPGENSSNKNIGISPNYYSQSYLWGIGIEFKNINLRYGRLNNHYQPGDISIPNISDQVRYVPYLRYRFRYYGIGYNHPISKNQFISFNFNLCRGKDAAWNSIPRTNITSSEYTAIEYRDFKSNNKQYSVYHTYNYLYGFLNMYKYSIGFAQEITDRLNLKLNLSYQTTDRALYENEIFVYDNKTGNQVGQYLIKSNASFISMGLNIKYAIVFKDINKKNDSKKH